MGSRSPLTTRVESRNGVSRIALSGELDMATVETLSDHLSVEEHGGASAVMVDIRDLTFIDSSGLRVLLRARERSSMNGHRFIVVGANATARRLLEITATEFLADEQEAVSVLERFLGDAAPRGDPASAPGVDADA